MKKIILSIQERLDRFFTDTAEAIDEGRWNTVVLNALLILLAVLILILLTVVTWRFVMPSLSGVFRKIFNSILGISLLYFLFLSYKAQGEHCLEPTSKKEFDRIEAEAWADEIYKSVEYAMFLVFRSLAAVKCTPLVPPESPSDISYSKPISVRDGYVVFNFFARLSDKVDVSKMKRELTRTLEQKIRAQELGSLSTKLVNINGQQYLPLQILDVLDFEDAIIVEVAFTNEKVLEVCEAKKYVHLERLGKSIRKPHNTLYDEEL